MSLMELEDFIISMSHGVQALHIYELKILTTFSMPGNTHGLHYPNAQKKSYNHDKQY